MELSPQHRRFFRNDQFLHAFAINFVFNGAIAWLLLRSLDTIPLWGDTSMGVDLLATGVLLPFLMCVIVSRVITGQVASGKLPPLAAEQIAATGLHQRPSWVRALVLVVFGTLCGSLPLVAILELSNAQPVPVNAFVVFKALWAGALAAMISPPLAWWALAAASSGERAEQG